MGDEVKLYNPHDGLTGRDGGPYLDEVERRNAEVIRAAKEGREPDFENAPATAGTPLVTAAVLAGMANPASNPSMEAQVGDASVAGIETLVKDKNSPLTNFSVREKTEDEKEAERLAKEDSFANNPASPVIIGQDPDYGQDSNPGSTPDTTTAPATEDTTKVAAKQDSTPASRTTKKSAAKQTTAKKTASSSGK